MIPGETALLLTTGLLLLISPPSVHCKDNSQVVEVEDYYAEDDILRIPPHLLLQEAQRRAGVLADSLPKLNMKVMEALSDIKPQDIILNAITTNISKACSEALHFIVDGLSDNSTNQWALEYFDSWGKVGSGLLSGHLKFVGNYDQCKNLTGVHKVMVNKTIPEERDFTTNYCTVSLPLVKKVLTVQLGVCIPNQCSAQDVNIFYDSILSKVPVIPLNVSSVSCQSLDYSLNTGRTVALVFVIIMISLCIVATIYDGIMQLLRTWSADSLTLVTNEDEESTPLISTSKSKSKPNVIPLKEGTLTKTILAFSLYSNASRILNADQPAGTLTCLNGIRFFSMTWVILGHNLALLSFGGQMYNRLWVYQLMKRFSFSPILNATLSVDTFFVLSGLLVSFLFLKDFHKRQIQTHGFLKALPIIYLHRYCRLTPAYGFMILIYTCLLWYVRDGPFWGESRGGPSQHTLDSRCVDHWYLNILYVNNLFQVDKSCTGWGWYLANDMQFFLIAPFLVYIIYLSSYIGLAVCILSVLGSIAAAISVSDQQGYKFDTSSLAHNNYTTERDAKLPYYFVPWSRYQTYGIGLITGFLIWKLKNINFQIPKVLNVILWGVSAGICMSVIYGPYSANMGYHTVYIGEVDIYNGLARTAWAVGISYVMISCSLGQGGWVNEFLSWRGFVPLSRLTYCAYLIHIPIIVVLYNGERSGAYFTEIMIVRVIVSTVTISFFVAFLFSMVFEAPFINLDKIYLAPLSLRKGRQEIVSHPKEIEKQPIKSKSGANEKDDPNL